MKTMQDYTLYCTEEQVKKAYNLGASINYYRVFIDNANPIELDGVVYRIPTAEQMCGWLREKGVFFVIDFCTKESNRINVPTGFYFIILNEGSDGKMYNTFEQAILAAIDAALNYLEKGVKL